MWLLDNATPFPAERTWVRDQEGAEVWIIAIKGSFLLDGDGRQVLDPHQTEVRRVPQFRGPPETSSLLYETDLVHLKRRTDVYVEGFAIAPRGRPVSTLDVRLKVQNVNKVLRVHGDRTIYRGSFGPAMSEPQPFQVMPITWERSFGGTDKKDEDVSQHAWEPGNPVGLGFATEVAHLFGEPAPNIEDPQAPYTVPKGARPAGFGPIARHWIPRVELAGTYDQKWSNGRCPLLPEDFDEDFYQCAPQDQQIDGFLKGGELVELHNLSAESYLSFPVPRVSFAITTRFYDGVEAQHRAVMHTLALQPNSRRFEVVWHSALPCHQRVNKLAVTRIALKKRINVSEREQRAGIWMGN